MNDTIAAISTTTGIGAISIIRLSGPESLEIASKVFTKDLTKVETHTIHYGYIKNNNEKIDEVLVSVMKAPKTFTKEDIVEINCHGGIATTNKVLEILLNNGARLAEPGEFTKRAFLNGRIDLLEAEATMDLISSKSDKARKMSLNTLTGETSNLIKDLRSDIVGIISNIEVNIDYPEYEDIEVLTNEKILPEIQKFKEKLEKIIKKSQDSKVIKEGIKVGMEAARPNVTDFRQPLYFVMKQPYAKVPRFIELPSREKNHYLMFTEDIIKANLNLIFPGYDVDSSYCIKISRDADILIDDTASSADLVAQLKKKVKKRKIGDVCRFVYDRAMPSEFLDFLVDAFRIQRDELVPGDKHLNLEDLRHLPNPNKSLHSLEKPKPMKLTVLDEKESIFNYVAKKDLLLYYPYHSFEHFIHFLYEAVHNPETREIMVTQYRVAENSAVINTLIAAAQNGKKVTVFVELKARFDEENNLATAEMMQAAGIKIIYSIPGLKVHAKVALIRRRGLNGEKIPSYAYISTGNFNEKTATLYADCGLFTCRKEIVADLYNLFRTLQGKEDPKFTTLLVARFNLIPELNRLIDREISLADEGKQGRIILKMNALQDPTMIDRLYEASEHGVQIDLIVRGICCLIPGQSYSRNIRVTRIVDSFLEHARIWYFGNDGTPKVFIGSPDWMRRNLYRRIEAITPVLAPDLRDSLIEMLNIQLADNQKACWVDDKLQNIFKKRTPGTPTVRAQYTFYDWLNKTNS